MVKSSEFNGMPEQVRRAYKELPERLYWIRKHQGWSQLDVELETGVLKESISMYENGNRYPVFDKLVRLAAFYGVSVAWLIGETK